jgi:hypothetical protein
VSTITDVVNIQTEVAQTNNLAGSNQVPIVPRYNPKLLE